MSWVPGAASLRRPVTACQVTASREASSTSWARRCTVSWPTASQPPSPWVTDVRLSPGVAQAPGGSADQRPPAAAVQIAGPPLAEPTATCRPAAVAMAVTVTPAVAARARACWPVNAYLGPASSRTGRRRGAAAAPAAARAGMTVPAASTEPPGPAAAAAMRPPAAWPSSSTRRQDRPVPVTSATSAAWPPRAVSAAASTAPPVFPDTPVIRRLVCRAPASTAASCQLRPSAER